jgi:checkpoint serine/threonine-protein kinase
MVDFNDDGLKSSRMKTGGRRSLLGGAEPTVTINTKEALADVFGMYNSPEKTTMLAVPGSKHAPLKKIEPVTPALPPRVTFLKENEVGDRQNHNTKTPTPGMCFVPAISFSECPVPAFKPFVDENAQPNSRTPASKVRHFFC